MKSNNSWRSWRMKTNHPELPTAIHQVERCCGFLLVFSRSLSAPLAGGTGLLSAALLGRTLGREADPRIRGHSRGFISPCHPAARACMVSLTLETCYLHPTIPGATFSFYFQTVAFKLPSQMLLIKALYSLLRVPHKCRDFHLAACFPPRGWTDPKMLPWLLWTILQTIMTYNENTVSFMFL